MDLDLSKASEAKTADHAEPVSFDLLALINQARNEHGMRQQDFHRYHGYCSTKVHRLRQTMNKTHTNTVKRNDSNKKGGKKGVSKKAKRKAQSATVQSENNKGKGNVFVRKTIDIAEVKDDRPAQLLLFEAERSWSYSQNLKQTAFEKDQDGKIRRHGLTRARRAVQWSKELLELIGALGEQRIDIRTRAEAHAYHVLLQAYETFDKEKHLESMEFLSVARKLLYLVAQAQSDSRKEALAHSYIDSTEPMLRFSAYSLELTEQDMDKLANTVASKEICERCVNGYSSLEAELQEQAKKNAGRTTDDRLDQVDWRGQSIPIRNADLVEVVTKVTKAETNLRESLKAKDSTDAKPTYAKGEHKRQRLTSAQRSAKKRGQLTTGASQFAEESNAGPSKIASTNVSAGSKTEMDGYDSLLASLTEAEDLARRLVQDNAEALSKSHSGRYEAASANLVNAHEYLLYKLLTTRAERNMALMEEVQAKSEKRQLRVREHVAGKARSIASPHNAKQNVSGKGKEPVRRRVKAGKKVRPANRPRHAASKKSKKSIKNLKPAPSASAPKKSPKTNATIERLRLRGEMKDKRISARIIPGLTRLLDANDMSCSGIAGLALVERDSNLATLIEAKSAWYKAELLRLLARSFAWSNELEKSLILLNRSELFVREARNAMELVEHDQVAKEDEQLPPQMINSTFDKTVKSISDFRVQVQRELYTRQLGIKTIAPLRRISDGQSKAAQALRDTAAKFVDFDPVDVQQASIIPSELMDKFDAELAGTSASVANSRRPSAVPVKAQAPSQPKAAPLEAVQKQSKPIEPAAAAVPATLSVNTVQEDEPLAEDIVEEDAEEGPYDPANLVDDEEEEEEAPKRGWLGGWLNRK
ncbi:hypothetical protein L7F22_044164 [Adiantum nelumboides]|nr:hypothetical protein [Adiantum nelumboides]